jgi:hypothetical protein
MTNKEKAEVITEHLGKCINNLVKGFERRFGLEIQCAFSFAVIDEESGECLDGYTGTNGVDLGVLEIIIKEIIDLHNDSVEETEEILKTTGMSMADYIAWKLRPLNE